MSLNYRSFQHYGREHFACNHCHFDCPSASQMERHVAARHRRLHGPTPPAVSCIMPTKGRPSLVPFAIRQFLGQTYTSRELIIVADEKDDVPCLPEHPQIQVVFAPPGQQSIGAKRNLACEAAKGRFVAHWDDDDLHDPRRLETQVSEFAHSRKLVGGISQALYQDLSGNIYRFLAPAQVAGFSLMFLREAWKQSRFPDKQVGEDSAFVHAFAGGHPFRERVHCFQDAVLNVGRIHSGNTSPKHVENEVFYHRVADVEPFCWPTRDTLILGMLTWNTKDISLESVAALTEEARRLRAIGYRPLICVVDNGSSDGTGLALANYMADHGQDFHLILNERNLGNSIARNQIIEWALKEKAKYLLFTDGDLEVIPWSVSALAAYLDVAPTDGCAGLTSVGCTPKREHISPHFVEVFSQHADRVQLVAWTQYGLFRMSMFEQGLRFEEGGPYGGPGWGFEDNELWLQMKQNRWESVSFFGANYLHRARQSSVRNLREDGQDPKALYDARKAYLLRKWGSDPIMKLEAAKIAATELREGA